jgi:hypothetical protein
MGASVAFEPVSMQKATTQSVNPEGYCRPFLWPVVVSESLASLWADVRSPHAIMLGGGSGLCHGIGGRAGQCCEKGWSLAIEVIQVGWS